MSGIPGYIVPILLGHVLRDVPSRILCRGWSGGIGRLRYTRYADTPPMTDDFWEIAICPIIRYRGTSYLSDTGRSRLDIEGARTPRRPLPNAVTGETGTLKCQSYDSYIETPIRTEDYFWRYFWEIPDIYISPVIRYRGTSYLSDPGRSRLDIDGTRTPRRPLPNAVTGETGYPPRDELWRLRRDAPGRPKIILENSVLNTKYLYPRLVPLISQRSRGISFRCYMGTYPETSPPECCAGGDREASDGWDIPVTPRRPFGTEDYIVFWEILDDFRWHYSSGSRFVAIGVHRSSVIRGDLA